MNLITHILFATTLVALPASLVAQEKKADAKPPAEQKQDPKAQDKKAEGFSVVQVGDAMKCVATAEVDTMKKQNQESFQKEMDAWKAAKKAAEDKKEKFDKPEPKNAAFSVVKGGFKSADEASAFITAEKEKHKKDEHKKDEKPKDEKPKDPPKGK